MTMDKEIELAKKLKEAGFPSVTKWEVENNYRRITMVNGDEMLPPLTTLLMELAKLVDECNFLSLTCSHDETDKWCVAENDGYESAVNGTWYSTPEEAVANLWLKLKNK